MHKEWEWDASEPLNLRENVFVASTLINTKYKIEYNGLNPYNILHRIQRRSTNIDGEPNVWVVLVLTY